jgi:hypothetical protein
MQNIEGEWMLSFLPFFNLWIFGKTSQKSTELSRVFKKRYQISKTVDWGYPTIKTLQFWVFRQGSLLTPNGTLHVDVTWWGFRQELTANPDGIPDIATFW